MVLIKFETTTKVVKLKTAQEQKDLGAYWITVEEKFITNKRKYISLYYPKEQAYKFFEKICNILIIKTYISYLK